ncbi:MAG TPA: ABC transporter ATP-binding protein [Levilinea sp.]|nr:ABC transporter ATP-binding protein [Levilinea sp.]
MTHPLSAIELSKSYGAFHALAPADLALEAGQITLLTGPNGAGKSTLLLCLAGLLRPTSGRVLVDGHDLHRAEVAARQALAFVPDVPRFYAELTAWEHLFFIAQAHTSGDGFEQRAETLMKDFGLWDARHLYPHHYSRGMRLKLGLLLALIRPFKVLLLDEPTSALDQQSTTLLLERLTELRHEGRAILLSTHNPSIAADLAARQLHIAGGQISEGAR